MSDEAGTLRVGIVGTGVGIRTHLAGLQSVEQVKVVGVVGSSLERAREHLSHAGAPVDLARSWEDLLMAEPDLVCITTPLDARGQYIDSLRAFKGSLLFEKPVVRSMANGADVRSALGDSFERSYTDFQLRGVEAFQLARASARAGLLGPLYEITLFERTSALRRSSVPAWMRTRRTGGGQMFAMGSHLLDLGIFLADVSYDEALTGSPSGFIEAPRRSWTSVVDVLESSDESFGCSLSVRGCHVLLTTTSISPGPRTLDVRVEGTEGCLEFRYRDGCGQMRIWNGDGSAASYAVGPRAELIAQTQGVAQLDPSLFRVAYPSYFEMVADRIRGRNGHAVATLMDGIRNSEILQKSIERWT